MATRIALRRVGMVLGASPRRACSSSALFVSDRSSLIQPILRPTPNLSKMFEDVEKLSANIKARQMSADAVAMKELWQFYCNLNETRETLESRRVEVSKQIKELMKGPDKKDSEVEKLKLLGRVIREDLKELMKAFWDVEERMMVNCLKLPNDLDPRTPLDNPQVIYWKDKEVKPAVDHLSAGRSLIDYHSPDCYYLKNAAAIFDLALMYYFLKGMKPAGYKVMVPPDFAHSAVVEGCGTDPKAAIGIEPVAEQLNVVGGASLYPLCAYYSKQLTPCRFLPGKHSVGGKRYVLADGKGLFGAWQKTCVDFFSISDHYDSEEIFNQTLSRLRELYEALGWDYRVKYVSARELKPWESFRVSFEMLAIEGWVEVGCVSTCGTFLSERLSMQIEDRGRGKHFGHVIAGTSVNVTSVLACILEQNAELCPPSLKPHTFGIF